MGPTVPVMAFTRCLKTGFGGLLHHPRSEQILRDPGAEGARGKGHSRRGQGGEHKAPAVGEKLQTNKQTNT